MLFKTWIIPISTDPSLVTHAVKEGLRRMGYKRIKPEQLTAVESLLNGDDVFVSIPTGFSKSLVYQLLPLCSESLLRFCKSLHMSISVVVVVVSP